MPSIESTRTSAVRGRTARGAALGLCMSAIGLAAVLTAGGCGLLPPDTYTIRVDSLTVLPGADAGQVSVRAHGMAASDGCGGLERVEREARGDTVTRRFVGERRSGNCTQMPLLLDFTEEVAVPSGRALRYVVRQPEGPPLVRDLLR